MDRGLDLRFRCDGERVTSDPALLEQVLGNLVGNALRYTARGGVLVAARRRRSAVRLEVWDTGAGLPRAHDRKLLIVDDDASVRIALGDLLTRWLVPFDAAADADAALRLVNSGDRYGMVLADYRLPGRLNGLELIAEIAVRHADPVPHGALTTADFDLVLISAARAARLQVIPKPLRPAQLRAILGLLPHR